MNAQYEYRCERIETLRMLWCVRRNNAAVCSTISIALCSSSSSSTSSTSSLSKMLCCIAVRKSAVYNRVYKCTPVKGCIFVTINRMMLNRIVMDSNTSLSLFLPFQDDYIVTVMVLYIIITVLYLDSIYFHVAQKFTVLETVFRSVSETKR